MFIYLNDARACVLNAYIHEYFSFFSFPFSLCVWVNVLFTWNSFEYHCAAAATATIVVVVVAVVVVVVVHTCISRERKRERTSSFIKDVLCVSLSLYFQFACIFHAFTMKWNEMKWSNEPRRKHVCVNERNWDGKSERYSMRKQTYNERKKRFKTSLAAAKTVVAAAAAMTTTIKKSGIKHDKMRRAQKTGEEAKRYVGEFDWTPKRVSERVYARRMYA